MALTDQVDVYCERTDFTFWSEPLNAFSNIAFLIAAAFCIRDYRRQQAVDFFAPFLIGFLIMTAIGSFLFHTFATRWAGLIDIVPIGLMIFTYHFAIMRRIAELSYLKALLSIALIPVLQAVMESLLPEVLGATKAYAFVPVLFCIYAIIYYKRQRAGEFYLLIAIATFVASLSMRFLDDEICNTLPSGLHYYWHILNALTLYLVFKAYCINLPPRKLKKI